MSDNKIIASILTGSGLLLIIGIVVVFKITSEPPDAAQTAATSAPVGVSPSKLQN